MNLNIITFKVAFVACALTAALATSCSKAHAASADVDVDFGPMTPKFTDAEVWRVPLFTILPTGDLALNVDTLRVPKEAVEGFHVASCFRKPGSSLAQCVMVMLDLKLSVTHEWMTTLVET